MSQSAEKKCPIPYSHEIHKMAKDHPRAACAITSGLSALIYYALPDMRCRFGSIFLRTATLVATGATYAHISSSLDDRDEQITVHDENCCAELNDTDDTSDHDDQSCCDDLPEINLNTPAIIGAIALSAAALAGTYFIERSIYRRGERRKAQGVRFAHTRQALPLAALSAVASYLVDATNIAIDIERIPNDS